MTLFVQSLFAICMVLNGCIAKITEIRELKDSYYFIYYTDGGEINALLEPPAKKACPTGYEIISRNSAGINRNRAYIKCIDIYNLTDNVENSYNNSENKKQNYNDAHVIRMDSYGNNRHNFYHTDGKNLIRAVTLAANKICEDDFKIIGQGSLHILYNYIFIKCIKNKGIKYTKENKRVIKKKTVILTSIDHYGQEKSYKGDPFKHVRDKTQVSVNKYLTSSLPKLSKIEKGEFETTKMFHDRVAREKNKYEEEVKEYKNNYSNKKKMLEKYILVFKNTAMHQVIGALVVKNADYDADKERMYLEISSNRSFYSVIGYTKIPLNEAKLFKSKIREINPKNYLLNKR